MQNITHTIENYLVNWEKSHGKNLWNEITNSDGSYDSAVGQCPGNWLGDRGLMVWVPSEARILLPKEPRPVCGPRGFLLVWNLCSLLGFKRTELLKLRTLDAVLHAQESVDRIISILRSFNAQVPYIYFNTKYTPEALKRILTAIRNRGVFQFQSGYMNSFLICCVKVDAPSIMFIIYISILNHTYYSARNLSIKSRLLPIAQSPVCLEKIFTVVMSLLGAFAK